MVCKKSQAPIRSWMMIVSSGQLLQQHFRLLQVFGVKPFGEPAVDLRQYLPGFFLLPLLLPQPAQAHHRPQLQRLRPLPAGNLARLPKIFFSFFDFGLALTCLELIVALSWTYLRLVLTRFGLVLDWPWTCFGLERQLALDPIHPRLVATLARPVHCCQRLGQHAQSVCGLPHFPIPLGQQGKKIRPHHLSAGLPAGGEPVPDLSNALLSPSLLDSRPPPQD